MKNSARMRQGIRICTRTRAMVVLMVLSLMGAGWADDLTTQSGDHLTGKVIGKRGDTLTFETSYGEPFNIRWDQVRELRTEEPVTLLMQDGTVIHETLKVGSSTELSDIEFINPEPWRLGQGWKLSGRFNLALKYERGNKEADEGDLDAEVVLRDLKNRVTLSGEVENDRNNNETTKDKWLVRGTYDRFVTRRAYVTGLVTADRDRLADLGLRVAGGPFVGYEFIQSPRTTLRGELGAIWVREEFDTGLEEKFWAGGWAIDFEQCVVSDVLRLYHHQNGFWSFERSDKASIKTWTGLRLRLWRGLIGSAEVKAEYESEPAETADDVDLTYRLKLGYEW